MKWVVKLFDQDFEEKYSTEVEDDKTLLHNEVLDKLQFVEPGWTLQIEKAGEVVSR